MASVALEPTACSSARLELPPEVVSGSVLVASAQFVGARHSTSRRLDLRLGRREFNGKEDNFRLGRVVALPCLSHVTIVYPPFLPWGA